MRRRSTTTEEEEDMRSPDKMDRGKKLEQSIRELETMDEMALQKGAFETKNITKTTPFYLYNTGFKVGSKKDNPHVVFTHGSMGADYQLSVPPDKHFEFTRKYYEAIHLNHENVCLDEKLSEFFHFVVDLDMEFGQKPTWKMLLPILGRIVLTTGHKFFAALYDKKHFSDDVCMIGKNEPNKRQWTTEDLYDKILLEWCGFGKGSRAQLCAIVTMSTVIEKSGGDGFKIGIHLNFPGTVVSCSEANVMRDYIVEDLKDIFGERNTQRGENTWGSVIDKNIYSGKMQGGLRMFGSTKIQSCPDCGGSGSTEKMELKGHQAQYNDPQLYKDMKKSAKVCETCMGSKKIHIRKMYSPQCVLVPDLDSKYFALRCPGIEDWLFDPVNYDHMVFATSIRSAYAESSKGFSMPSGIVPVEATKKKKKLTNPAEELNDAPIRELKENELPITTPHAKLLNNMIRDWNPNWEQLRIKSITTTVKYRHIIKIEVEGIGAGYCMHAKYNGRLGKDHAQDNNGGLGRQQRIFFELWNPKGLVQKCWHGRTKGSEDRYGCQDKNNFVNVRNYLPLTPEMNFLFFGDRATGRQLVADRLNTHNQNSLSRTYSQSTLGDSNSSSNKPGEIQVTVESNVSEMGDTSNTPTTGMNKGPGLISFRSMITSPQLARKRPNSALIEIIASKELKSSTLRETIQQDLPKKEEQKRKQTKTESTPAMPVIRDPTTFNFLTNKHETVVKDGSSPVVVKPATPTIPSRRRAQVSFK